MKLDETQGGKTCLDVRFRGVRGSHPISRPGAAYFGGNTSCVEVSAAGHSFIFDLGTGLVGLGNELAGAGAEGLMLVSHLHHDHTMGFPFFKPIYHPGSRFMIAGPSDGSESFQELFDGTFQDPYFPVNPSDMPSERDYRTLECGSRLSWGKDEDCPRLLGESEAEPEGAPLVRVFRNDHHPNGGVLNFRLEHGGRSLVLATDVEGTSGGRGDLVAFAKGTDLLIHDAQYTEEEYDTYTKGWGHSTWRMAADVAERSKSSRLVLYHHDPAHDDPEVQEIERLTQGEFSQCLAAAEGLEIRV